MDKYIQIGVTALRDPMTGNFLKSVPLYIREEDSAQAAPLDDFPVAKIFAEKFKQYKAECRKKGIKV